MQSLGLGISRIGQVNKLRKASGHGLIMVGVFPNMEVCLFPLLLPQVQTTHLSVSMTIYLKTGRYACMVSRHSTSSTTRPCMTMHGGSLCTVVKNQVQATLYPWVVLMCRQNCTSSNPPSLHSVLLLQFMMCIPSLHSVLLLQLIVCRYCL